MKPVSEPLSSRFLWLIRVILALAAFLLVGWKFGFQVLDPTHDSWLYFIGSDITPDYFAWIFYRDTPWQFPLGVIENYSYPVVTSVGLTGGIPLLAVPFKALSPILPDTFQYYGWWFLMNYILQGWAAVFLLRKLRISNPWLLLLGGAIFILSPPFLDRHPHANLTAHWVLLYALGTALATAGQMAPRKKMRLYAVLTFAATWIHPYLVLFPLGFSFADWLKTGWFEKALGLRKKMLWPALTVAGLLLAYFLIGYHIMPAEGAVSSGFGRFSANLNTFFNSMDRMALIPGLPLAFSDQYEGFAYLGAGMICLLVAAFFLAVWKRPFITSGRLRNLIPVLALVLGFFALALSSVITFQDKVLVEIPLGKTLSKVFSTFRASGRYVWALHYLLFGGIMWLLVKRIQDSRILIPVFGLALIIQLIDVKPYIPSQNIYPHSPYETPLKSPAWSYLFDQADLIVMEPAYSRTFAFFGDDMYFIRLAHETQTPITAGHLARYDDAARNRMRDSIRTVQETGNLGDRFSKAVFASTPAEAGRFSRLIRNGAVKALYVDGYVLYVPAAMLAEAPPEIQELPPLTGSYLTAADFIKRHPRDWVFIAAKDEASFQLCDSVKRAVQVRGGSLHTLGFRQPYMAVIYRDQVLWDSVYAAEGPHTFLATPERFPALPDTVRLVSGGGARRACEIVIQGKQQAPGERGLNLVAADSALQVLESNWFDTYEQCGRFFPDQERQD